MCRRQFCTGIYVKLGLLGTIVAVVGCGGNPATVSGVVTIDGQPLNRGSVGFTPVSGGMKAVGAIQSDGSYELKTNREVGLQIGEYMTTVVALEPGKPDPQGGPPVPGKRLTPKHYGSTKTSELRFNVEKGGNEINLELSSEGLDKDNKRRRGRR